MTAPWFDGHIVIPLVKPGTREERVQARHNAAVLVVRNGGDAEDLKRMFDQLALWPHQDPVLLPFV